MKPLLFAIAAVLVLGADDPKAGLDIYFIDVDGGAATLLVTPERKSVLIDSGWPGRDDRDPKRIVHVLRNVAGLERIDHLVTTHWHTDHFGGVEGLAKLVPIDRFWDRGLPEDGTAGLDFPDGPKSEDPLGIAYRRASQGKRKALKSGDTLPLGNQISAMVLTSGGKVYREDDDLSKPINRFCENSPADLPVDGSDNARSLTLIFRFGNFDFLDCGDLTWNIEKKLVCPVDRIRLSDPKQRQDNVVDLFQVTHHGMDISNHPTLLKTIQPTVAVMDNGPKKGGAPATVKLMVSQPSIKAFYQLHKNAATGAEENTSPDLIANSDPVGGQFIKVSVVPDGSKYTVQIGGNGVAKEFETR